MVEGISEDVKEFRRSKAHEFHRAAVHARLDLQVAEELQAGHPDRDLTERVKRARTSLRETEDLARRIAAHAGVVRTEFDAPIRVELADQRLPALQREVATIREMLDNLDIYNHTLTVGEPPSPVNPQGRPPLTVEGAHWYLAQHETAIRVIEAFCSGDKNPRSGKTPKTRRAAS